MSQDKAHLQFPRSVLIGAAVLLCLTLVMAVAGRQAGIGTTKTPASEAVETKMLTFADRSDGGIDIVDVRTGVNLFMAPQETNGFLRGVLRGMSQGRRLENVGPQAPYRLTRWADGRLSLTDPSTGREVNLEVFGPDNYRVFAQLMTPAASGN